MRWPSSRRLRWGATLAGFFALVATAAGVASAAPPRLRDVRIEPAVATLAPGETLSLRAFAVFDDGSEQDVTAEVAFDSRDPSTVEVNGNAIRGLASGETTVRATHLPTGERANDALAVTVLKITELVVQPPDTTLAVGATAQLGALATLEDGRAGVDVTQVVEWQSGKRDVASVDRGTVAALGVGDAEIRVLDRSNGIRSPKNAAFVHVVDAGGGGGGGRAELVALRVQPTEASLLPGEDVALRVVAELSDGSTQDVTAEATYESSRPRVATVDASGRVTAVADGQTHIEVRHPSGVSADVDPSIWVGRLEQINLAPDSPELSVGDVLALQALGTYDNGRARDLTDDVAWSSDDPGVIVVSNAPGAYGRLSAVGPGTAIVRARDPESGLESRRSDGEIRVVGSAGGAGGGDPGEIRDLVFEPPVVRLLPGETEGLRVFAVFRDGSTMDVSDRVRLSSRDRRVVRVEGGNRITALAGGQTDVSAFDPMSRTRSRVRARVEVTRMIALSIDPQVLSLAPGETAQLRALADFDDGSRGIDVTAQMAWRSSRPGTVAVDDGIAKGRITAMAEGRAEIEARDPASGLRSSKAGGKVLVGAGVPPGGGGLVALDFEPALLVLDRGGTATVKVFGVAADGSRSQLDPADVRLASLSRRYVSVGRSGVLYGRRGGTGEVRAQHRPSGLEAVLPVLVRELNRIDIEPASVVLRVGDAFDLHAIGGFNDGSTSADVTATVRWHSRDRSIVEVDDDAAKGRITALAPGSALIEAQDRRARVRSDASTGQVKVVDQLLAATVEPAAVVLDRGDEVALTALGHFDDGTVVALGGDAIWSVSDPGVAAVLPDGTLRALADGQTRVTVTDRRTGISSSPDGDAMVRVGLVLTGLQVSADPSFSATPARLRLGVGETARLFGLAAHQGVSGAADLSATLLWSSSDPAVVAVEPGGLVTCRAVGSATVAVADVATGISSTGTLGDATVECGGEVVAIRVEPAAVNLDYPKSKQMRAFRVFADGFEAEVTREVLWSTNDPAALSIVETGGDGGLATALDDGIVTVTATDPGSGLSSSDPGGQNGVVTVRKTRVELRIFPIFPLPDADSVHRGHVGELVRLKARVTYASGATQGVNLLVEWTSSDASVVQMGAAAGLPVNQGLMLSPGMTTITARWPADETSPELTDSIQVQVLP